MNSPRRLATAASMKLRIPTLAIDSPRRTLAVVALLAGFLTAASAHAAPIMLTYSGTVTNISQFDTTETLGYSVGAPVSFSITVNDYAPETPSGSVSAFQLEYSEESSSNPSLWAGFTGTGLAGTYHKAPGDGPFERLRFYPTGILETKLRTDSFNALSNNHGIYSAVNSDFVLRTFDVRLSGYPAFVMPESLVYPTDYLASYTGSYNSLSLVDGFEQVLEFQTSDNRNVRVSLGLSSVEISAVPEPSTYAMALAGLACGGYSVFRRRQRA